MTYGPDDLRAACNLAGNTRDAERWTAEEWLRLLRAYRASEWDYTPDEWTDRQVAEALHPIAPLAPRFSDDYVALYPGKAMFAIGDRVRFTDTIRGAGTPAIPAYIALRGRVVEIDRHGDPRIHWFTDPTPDYGFRRDTSYLGKCYDVGR
jgi:hypothetical protein